MSCFELNILGCGSALPTTRHFPSSQVLNLRDKLYMVDCGEGAQIQLRSMHLKFNRLNHIFISHMHGDHCFGLPGLLSTLGLLGRTGELVVHAHPDAQKIFGPVLDYFCGALPYNVRFNPVDPYKSELVHEDRTVKVYSIPLKHRIPTCGYLFQELPKSAHIIRDMIDFHRIPVKQIAKIKEGADFVAEDGSVIPNQRLTRPADPPKKYAYCSDTAYYEKIIPIIQGVDLLFHEATFCEADKTRANETFHSSAKQAAMIAKAAGVKKLILGHFSARYPDNSILLEEAKTIFPDTILAKEDLVVKI
ncbi:MAG: ribonuclease Z [Dysgonamonadaceae bacterium]|jgi:ribonuclease Z|nr:ribonuclease Z [Dysgonamonadaceae bacterium]